MSEDELSTRRAEKDLKGWKPTEKRKRNVTTALRAYAAFATSADKGAVASCRKGDLIASLSRR